MQFKLEDFEGPLDLLLALVQKNKRSIYDIGIVTLIDQYLEIVAGAGEDLDDASEFIVMAARLVQMKSVMLLPRGQEADRLREELTGLLVEYGACKEMAAKLGQMAAGVFVQVRRPLAMEFSRAYRGGQHGPAELAAAYTAMMGRSTARRMPRPEQFDELVSAPLVSVTGRVIYLLRGLKAGLFSRLAQPFRACRSRGETVATFLALLELMRGGRIWVDDREGMRLAAPKEGKAARRGAKGRGAGDGT